MAVYNGEKFLIEQLDSIIPQLSENDEIVISYDQSTDGTLALVTEYSQKDSRIKLIINNTPGLFANFENAIKFCSNDIVFISDQDDIWDLQKCSTVMKYFEENDRIDMVIHNGIHFNSLTDEKSTDFFNLHNISNNRIRNFLKPRYSGCCMAFKRELTSTLLPIPSNVGGYDHWIGMVGETFGEIKFVDDILIYHRLHNSNFTPTSRRGLIEVVKYRSLLLIELCKRWWKVRA
ncbi:TPA: glycosyltransferase [Streptococcus suis]|nr:glycosyltransferase [Streptococcus suis]